MGWDQDQIGCAWAFEDNDGLPNPSPSTEFREGFEPVTDDPFTLGFLYMAGLASAPADDRHRPLHRLIAAV